MFGSGFIFGRIFTESAPRPIQSLSRCVRLSVVCLFFLSSLSATEKRELETSGQRAYQCNCKTKNLFYVSTIFSFFFVNQPTGDI